MARDMFQYRADRAAVRDALCRILDAVSGIHSAFSHGDTERAERHAAEIEQLGNGVSFLCQRIAENVAGPVDASERSAQ